MNNQLTMTTEYHMTQIENTPSYQSLMNTLMAATPYLPEADVTVNVFELTEDDRNEVLAFLAERPIHTVCMTGFIRDNGLVSPHNRGTFYGCRNSENRLEGVALVGHATLIEARSLRAMREFGLVAQTHTRTHMIMGEVSAVEDFWNYYADDGQEMRRACRELLFELRHSMDVREESAELRRANLADLDQIVPVQAAMAEFESGINPWEVDPEGFRARCARRIEMGRVWVLEQDGKLVFKADIQADTPDVIYLEGVWVASSERGKGIGRKCLRQLCRDLLTRTKSVCLLVNEESERAHTFYRMCNFKMRGVYDSIFLRQN